MSGRSTDRWPQGSKALAHIRATMWTPEAHNSWPFFINPEGYARLRQGRISVSAHAVACELAYGPRPPGMVAAHACRNKHCYWAEHVSWETPRQNAHDRWRDGTVARGEHCGSAKLTDAAVLAIRERWKINEGIPSGPGRILTREMLAAEYGVSIGTICAVVNRRTWRHL